MKKKLLFLTLTIISVSALALSIYNHFDKPGSVEPQLLDVGVGGTPPSAYSTTLTLGESSTDATINVASVTAGDTALTTGSIYPGIFLTIEPQSSTKREIVFCTGISSLTFTGCTRGLTSVGDSLSAVTANQQSHQAGVLVIASDPAQFYSHILVNRWNESWIYGKHHEASATSSDRTGFSLGNGQAVDIMLIFKDDTATSTAPRLYRQESTGNLIWSGNGVDEITLSGGGASSTCGRGAICEAVTGGTEVNVATSTDTNSANLYGLSFILQGGRDRLRLSGNYFGDFTINNLFASSTNSSSTSYFSHLVPSINNAFDLGSGTTSWRNINSSGTLFVAGNATTTGNIALGDTVNDSITFWGRLASSTIPNVHNSYDVGSYPFSWANIHSSGTIFANNFNLAGAFNSSSTSYQDSVITFATSTTGLYAYYHQATGTPGGPLTITIPIPGRLLGVNSSIRLNASGSSTRPTDGVTAIVAVSFGGTTFSTFSFEAGCREAAPASSCTGSQAGDDSIMWQLTTLISNRNSNSIQKGYGTLVRGNEQFIATSSVYRPETLGAIDTTNDQNLLLRLTSDNYTGGTHLGIEDLTVEILNAR